MMIAEGKGLQVEEMKNTVGQKEDHKVAEGGRTTMHPWTPAGSSKRRLTGVTGREK